MRGRGGRGPAGRTASRGRGRGRGRSFGPTLPGALQEELGFQRTPNPGSRKRKAAAREDGDGRRRSAASAQVGASNGSNKRLRGPSSSVTSVEKAAAASGRSGREAGTGGAAGRRRVDARAGAAAVNKSAHQLALEEDIEREARLQAQLAKKLKLKKGKTVTGPEDGLDDILAGIDGLDELMGPPKTASIESVDDESDDESDIMAASTGQDSYSDNESDSIAQSADLDEGSGDGESDGGDEDSLRGMESDRVSGDGSGDEREVDGGEVGSSVCGRVGQKRAREKARNGSEEEEPDDDSGSDSEEESLGESFDLLAGGTSSDDDEGYAGSRRTERRGSVDGEAGGNATALQTADKPAQRYIPPALRAKRGGAAEVGSAAAAGPAAAATEEDERLAGATRRKIKSLVNRAAAANVAALAGDIADLFHQAPRNVVIGGLIDTILKAIEDGPRAADQFAAVTGVLVTAVAALARAQDLAAQFVLAISEALQRARDDSDSIASSNLVRVLCYLYLCKLVDSEFVFSLLDALRAQLSDGDVSLIVAVLNAVGLALRADDAMRMKQFVVGVHARASDLGAEGALSQRARLMLDMVVDIKNNRRAKAEGARGGSTAAVPSELAKFVRGCGVESVALQHLPWDKLLSCEKKGMWWLPQAHERGLLDGPQPLAGLPGRGAGADPEEARLLKLAAAQRMNTDTRRAVFCVLMAADDYIDAFERLMRLPLKGEADREIVRVVLDCCLQEQAWNPYYALVALRLISASKSHRMTLQYALWDKFKELDDANMRHITNMAHFVGLLLGKQALPLSMLKVVSFADLPAKGVLFWRAALKQVLSAADDSALRSMFGAVAAKSELSTLKGGLKLFIKTRMGPWLAAQPDESARKLIVRLHSAESALSRKANVNTA